MGASLDRSLFSPRKSKGDCAKEIGADMERGGWRLEKRGLQVFLRAANVSSKHLRK